MHCVEQGLPEEEGVRPGLYEEEGARLGVARLSCPVLSGCSNPTTNVNAYNSS